MSDKEFEYLYSKYPKQIQTKEEIKSFVRFCEYELSKNFYCKKENVVSDKCNSQCSVCYNKEMF